MQSHAVQVPYCKLNHKSTCNRIWCSYMQQEQIGIKSHSFKSICLMVKTVLVTVCGWWAWVSFFAFLPPFLPSYFVTDPPPPPPPPRGDWCSDRQVRGGHFLVDLCWCTFSLCPSEENNKNVGTIENADDLTKFAGKHIPEVRSSLDQQVLCRRQESFDVIPCVGYLLVNDWRLRSSLFSSLAPFRSQVALTWHITSEVIWDLHGWSSGPMSEFFRHYSVNGGLNSQFRKAHIKALDPQKLQTMIFVAHFLWLCSYKCITCLPGFVQWRWPMGHGTTSIQQNNIHFWTQIPVEPPLYNSW